MVNQYVLKVYPLGLGNEVYRTLEICGDSTLDQLCDAIMAAFDFFHEHLYEFCMDNKMFSEHCYQYNPLGRTECRHLRPRPERRDLPHLRL